MVSKWTDVVKWVLLLSSYWLSCDLLCLLWMQVSLDVLLFEEEQAVLVTSTDLSVVNSHCQGQVFVSKLVVVKHSHFPK